jgi:hypothetical protein
MIVQLRVKRNFKTWHKFASAYVQQRLREAAYQQGEHNLLTYMGVAGAAAGATDVSKARRNA